MRSFRIAISEEKLREIEQKIHKSTAERRAKFGDVEKIEKEAIGNLLNYGSVGVEEISYDLYNARKFEKIFPEESYHSAAKTNFLKGLYRKIVRKIFRGQIVFNQSVVGVLNDFEVRLAAIEKKIDSKKNNSKNKPEKDE